MMAQGRGAEAISAVESRRRRRTSAGIVILTAAALAGLGFVVWGVSTSAPAPVAPVIPEEPQWGKVSVGDLVEESSVEGTVSRGEIFSVSVAQAPIVQVTTTTTATAATDSVATTAGASPMCASASTRPLN